VNKAFDGMFTRRQFFRLCAGVLATGAGFATYGVVIEPGFRLAITEYNLNPTGWTPGLKLRAVVLADPHCVDPHMTINRWQKIIATANELAPDVHLLLGDYLAHHRFRTGTVAMQDVALTAKSLVSPLGTFGICGNHDWWTDRDVQAGRTPLPYAVKMFEDVGIPMLENRAVRLQKDEKPFWFTGTSSIIAISKSRRNRKSRADLDAALGQVKDKAPIIHLAHEPDMFVKVPDRVSLTISGHTHGGQVRLFGYAPMTASSYGQRFNYGHVVEDGRNLIVSGGLGCSALPIRFGSPPEIVVINIG
jgi:uncharacterized protein